MVNELLTQFGEIVDGRYRLGNPARYSGDESILETEFGYDAQPAVIRIIETKAPGAEDLTGQWQKAMALEHPNLIRVYATGPSMLNGVPIVYAVMERADESLERVLAERALTVDETRRVLMPVLAALRFLHMQGYAHSHLIAGNVLAVGDQLKLSSDSLMTVPHQDRSADDMRALGVLLVQALTQKAPEESGVVEGMPAPFDEIVRHCLEPDARKRWTAEQVAAWLNPPEVPPAPLEIVPEVEELAERRQPANYLMEEPAANGFFHSMPKWIYGACAALVLIAVLVTVTRKKVAEPVTPATSRVVTEQAPVAVVEKAPPVPTVANSTRSGGRKAEGWAVIVAAYNSREGAEKRRTAIAKKWPGFHVTIADAQSDRARYVITLGRNLSEDGAEALRRRAIKSGMGRDTYIKRMQAN